MLSEHGVSLGELNSSESRLSWADIVGARLRKVENELGGICTDGLNVSLADGSRLHLKNSYDFPLEELNEF